MGGSLSKAVTTTTPKYARMNNKVVTSVVSYPTHKDVVESNRRDTEFISLFSEIASKQYNDLDSSIQEDRMIIESSNEQLPDSADHHLPTSDLIAILRPLNPIRKPQYKSDAIEQILKYAHVPVIMSEGVGVRVGLSRNRNK